jgi:hypothetical protein
MNTDKLIALKENFTGQRFQWIKTTRPELLGKVVKCRDVDFGPGGSFIVTFDDGSKIDSTKLNSDLLMIHGDMQPLSKGEVESINGPKPSLGLNAQPTAAQPAARVTPTATMAEPRPQFNPAPSASNMFEMFNSDETQISIGLKVKLPDRKLLKMMYTSAENKDKFLAELSEYLYSKINKQVIKESMQQILDPTPIRREARPIINLKEVDESR